MQFNYREQRDLVIAGSMLSLAFAILLSGGLRGILSFDRAFITLFAIAFFTAGIGFAAHELMHKYVAQRYGLRAEFQAFYPMLWLALLFSFFGFIFAAPGAVFISGAITRERNGRISLAGPMTNIVLATIFAALLLIPLGNGPWNTFFEIGLSINALLAAFNMIPALPFDGAKIIAWSKGAYAIAVTLALALFLLSLWR